MTNEKFGFNRKFSSSCVSLYQRTADSVPIVVIQPHETSPRTGYTGILLILIVKHLYSDRRQEITQTFGQQLHAENFRELLHFDDLQAGESVDGKEYILIFKYDFFRYVFQSSCSYADADKTPEVVIEYITTFIPVLNWMNGQGRHFKKEIMELLAILVATENGFGTSYVPLKNITLESVCKQTIKVIRCSTTYH